MDPVPPPPSFSPPLNSPPPPPDTLGNLQINPSPPPPAKSPVIITHASPPNHLSSHLKYLVFPLVTAILGLILGYLLGLGGGADLVKNYRLLNSKPQITPIVVQAPATSPTLSSFNFADLSISYPPTFQLEPQTPPTLLKSNPPSLKSLALTDLPKPVSQARVIFGSSSQITIPECQVFFQNSSTAQSLPTTKQIGSTTWWAGQSSYTTDGATTTSRIYRHFLPSNGLTPPTCYEVLIQVTTTPDNREDLTSLWNQLETLLPQ